jgi:hypothetical protein
LKIRAQPDSRQVAIREDPQIGRISSRDSSPSLGGSVKISGTYGDTLHPRLPGTHLLASLSFRGCQRK